MVNFDNVANKQVSETSTALYELFDIDMEASLIVSPATRSNKAYTRALMKIMLPMQRRLSSGKTSPEFVDKFRKEIQPPLYADHIIKDWEGVVDATGEPVPCSAENKLAFMKALPAQAFDNLVAFCEEEPNFRDTDSQALAKNSPPY